MKSGRWEGTATALSSISHGGETLGTITYLRREAFLTPSGRIDIPVISGNAVRGVLRDTAAHLLWDALERPSLPLAVVHALWAGGALVKSRGQVLSGQRLATLRTMVAHVGVFGAAGGGRILDSALTVGKLVPVCAQTAHILPSHVLAAHDGPLPDVHDLLQIERYSRIPDADRLAATVDAEPSPPDTETSDAAPFDEGLMRYGTETFISGTRFHAHFALRNAAPTEHAFFADALDIWLNAPTVGGKIGRGHGKMRFDLTYTGDPIDHHTDWRAFGGADRDEVIRALNWLD